MVPRSVPSPRLPAMLRSCNSLPLSWTSPSMRSAGFVARPADIADTEAARSNGRALWTFIMKRQVEFKTARQWFQGFAHMQGSAEFAQTHALNSQPAQRRFILRDRRRRKFAFQLETTTQRFAIEMIAGAASAIGDIAMQILGAYAFHGAVSERLGRFASSVRAACRERRH